VVDKFVIVEARTTHSGKDKPLHYRDNYKRYEEFAEKIIYVPTTLPELKENTTAGRCVLENAQRMAMMRALDHVCRSDYVMVSDCDEIPVPGHVERGEEGVYSGPMYMYYANRQYPYSWNGTVGVRGWRLFSPYGRMNTQDMRNARDLLKVAGYGFHFSWVGSDPKVKSTEFAHAELDTPEFRSMYKTTVHPTEGVKLKLINPKNGLYPLHLSSNLDKYSHLFEGGV
jgi:beta-1,4-mannosyl-glycoprotein beta-1,4-N-acetylglucosaminyltransferase